MPKKLEPRVKERCVRLVLDHLPEYPLLTAAAAVVARREELGKEMVRRWWVVPTQIEGGHWRGPRARELVENKGLKAKVRCLEEENEILRQAIFFTGALDPPNH